MALSTASAPLLQKKERPPKSFGGRHLGVAVAEAGHGAAAADEVEILLALGIPQPGALTARDDHRHPNGCVESQQV